jgi:glycosyltransferase involved in cell wall biosynthesis
MALKKSEVKATYIRISYPDSLNKQCPVCKNIVIHKYPTAGKLVHTLSGDIYQVVELYQCSNRDCPLHKNVFNPAPRFDYSNRSYGEDVIQWISGEMFLRKQSIIQIHNRITNEKNIDISLATIYNIANDIQVVKRYRIDETTLEIIKKQGYILLGLDGKDPDGGYDQFWNFKDLISNRILHTEYVSSINFESLHEIIERITALYNVPIIGWVSDKQGLIRKCHDEFYSDIPHAYCHYHFLANVFSYLSALDSYIFMKLKTAITGLYIHKADASVKVDFGTHGERSIRDVFSPIDKDLMYFTKATTVKFKRLRGLEIYTELPKYLSNLKETFKFFDKSARFTKILFNNIDILQNVLDEVKDRCMLVEKIWGIFSEICTVLGSEHYSSTIQSHYLYNLFGDLWNISLSLGCPYKSPDDCSSRLASKTMSEWECVCQMVRLFLSYEPGLFAYFKFPIPIKTNNSLETDFSQLSASFRGQSKKARTGLLYAYSAEEKIRFLHCDIEELTSNIIEDFERYNIDLLRISCQERKHAVFKGFYRSGKPLNNYDSLFFEFHDLKIEQNCSEVKKD